MPGLFAFLCNNKAAVLNSVGLLLTIFGVLLLFFFVVAFQVRTGGSSIRTTMQKPGIKQERRNLWLASVGLGFIVVGTFCQIAANWV